MVPDSDPGYMSRKNIESLERKVRGHCVLIASLGLNVQCAWHSNAESVQQFSSSRRQ